MNKILLGITLFLTIPSLCLAKDECKSNQVNFDTCKAAREFSDELATSLPMQMSQNIRLEKVFAIKSMVSMHAVLGYTKQYLELESSKAGVTMETLEEKMRNATIANICHPKSPTLAFIKLGGKIQYVYRFSDYMPYLEIDIKKCS